MDVIIEVGFIDPVMLDENNIIQCGNGAVEAARALGIEEVPYVRISHLGPDQLRAFRIAHNRLAEKSEWDQVILREELRLLPLDLQPITGFDPAALLAEMPMPELGLPGYHDDDSEDESDYEPEKTVQEGIRVPILIELTKPQAKRARQIRKEAGFDGDWAGFFLNLLDNLSSQ